MRYLCLMLITAAASGAQTGRSDSVDLDSLVGTLKSAAKDRDPTEVMERLRELEDSDLTITEPLLGELLGLMTDASIHPMVRMELLTLVCVRAHSDGASEIVRYLGLLLDQYEARPRRPVPDIREGRRIALQEMRRWNKDRILPLLLYKFFVDDDRCPVVEMEDQSSVLNLASRIAISPAIHALELKRAVIRCVAESPALKSLRQDFAFEIIRAYSNRPTPKPLLGLMDDDLAKRLRPFVLKGSDGEDSIHSGASLALADYGDQETGVLLQRWAARQDDPEWAARHIERRLWRINARREPELLLEYIKSDEWHGPEDRLWAMKKALSLGLPREELRKAILDHAKVVKGHAGLEWSLERFKLQAQERGVLRGDDLPEVLEPPKDMVEAAQRMEERRKELQDE